MTSAQLAVSESCWQRLICLSNSTQLFNSLDEHMTLKKTYEHIRVKATYIVYLNNSEKGWYGITEKECKQYYVA